MVALANVGIGAFVISPAQVLAIVAGLADLTLPVGYTDQHESVLLSVRLPRAVLAGLVGAALGASGAVYQGIFRNPLASPSMLGVSGGAAAGASVVIVLGLAGAGAPCRCPNFVAAEASILYLSEPDVLRSLRMITEAVGTGELALDTWGVGADKPAQDRLSAWDGRSSHLGLRPPCPTEPDGAEPVTARVAHVRRCPRTGPRPVALLARLLLPRLSRISRAARSYRQNLFDIDPSRTD